MILEHKFCEENSLHKNRLKIWRKVWEKSEKGLIFFGFYFNIKFT